MFIQPIFEYKPEEWQAMIYSFNPQNPSDKPLVGFMFQSEEYATEFFDLLRAYNNGESIDKDNNIRLSIIIEDPENYSVYIYPSEDRKSVTEFIESSVEELGENVQPLIMQLTMCKWFPYGENSTLKAFREVYKSDMEVELTAFTGNRNTGHFEKVDTIEPIIKTDILITNRKLLDKNSMEAQHFKNFK